MQHFGEIFSAEIYARNAVDVGDVRRGKEVLKPWVSNGGSFGTFLSLLKEKYEHSAQKVSPSVTACAVPPPSSHPPAGGRARAQPHEVRLLARS